MQVDSLDEVMGRSKVLFSKAIEENELGTMLFNVGNRLERLPFEIPVRWREIRERQYDEAGKVKTTGIEVTGTFYSNGESADFRTVAQSLAERTKIIGIQFQIIPGYSLKEHRKGQVALWDNIRKCITDYYSY